MPRRNKNRPHDPNGGDGRIPRFPMTLDAEPLEEWMAHDHPAHDRVRLETGEILTFDQFAEFQRLGRIDPQEQARYQATFARVAED